MKKLLAIIVLGLVLNGNAYADVRSFNKWLYDNGHYDLVEKVETEKCKSLDKDDTSGNWQYYSCDKSFYKNKSEIYQYPSRYWIPENNPKPKPNYITLVYEFFRYSWSSKPKVNKISIKKSEKPYEFKFNITKNKYDKHIDKALNHTLLLVRLYF